MHYDIKNHSIVVSTFEGKIVTLDLHHYNEIKLSYDKKVGKVIMDLVEPVKSRFIMDMYPEVPKKEVPVMPTAKTVKEPTTGERCKIMPQPTKKRTISRRATTTYSKPMKKMSVQSISTLYLLYKKGEPVQKLSRKYDIKVNTIYSWVSTITRVLSGAPVEKVHKKLQQTAVYIKSQGLSEGCTVKHSQAA
jgi:transposase-like protein